ncbi:MAG: HugZ family protein [Aquabacterium sp.]
MAEPSEPPQAANRAADLWQARTLLRAARVATLATQTGGQPFTALVTPAAAPDLSVLLWLSSLSEHTRHLMAEPRCAVMVAGVAESANPQTAPRITLTGLAELAPDPALKARWLAVHPYAALYAGFGDFALWRVRPLAGLFVGGFARATRQRAAELAPDPASVAAIAAAEAEIIAHCNADHADAMAELAGAPLAGAEGPWRMVAVDVDGCDLACAEASRRIAWSAPVADAAGVRKELITLLRQVRLPRN